ncbi:MAG TPA: alpha/beta fold hydrolase [Candidatus Acidoferrales bacterium]|nr:alpha/beta fold hydrolase [Candidatus Acidoferrales bacterium]
MDIIEELRDPSSPTRGALTLLLLLVLLLGLVCAGIAMYLDYRMLHPVSTKTSLTLEELLQHASAVPYSVAGQGSREGWFFPGLRGGPVLILCHGYRWQRGDVLTLATTLEENQYNVFVFDFSGHGKSSGSTTMGPREATEVLTAIAVMGQRSDVDKTRVGLWGVDMGGYAALVAATADRRVAAVVADSVYDDPLDFFRIEMDQEGYGSMPVIGWMGAMFFRVAELPYRGQPSLSARLGPLARIPKLFIALRENKELAQSTLRIFGAAPEPKEQWVMPQTTYLTMTNDEKRTYDNTVLSFFLRTLPPTPVPAGNR